MSKNFDTKSLEVLFVVAGARLNNLPVIIPKFINLFKINKFTVVCPASDINKATKILEEYIVNIIDEKENIVEILEQSPEIEQQVTKEKEEIFYILLSLFYVNLK
jgi:hypothetical protein